MKITEIFALIWPIAHNSVEIKFWNADVFGIVDLCILFIVVGLKMSPSDWL